MENEAQIHQHFTRIIVSPSTIKDNRRHTVLHQYMYVNAVSDVQFKTVTNSFTNKLCICTTVTYHVARTKWVVHWLQGKSYHKIEETNNQISKLVVHKSKYLTPATMFVTLSSYAAPTCQVKRVFSVWHVSAFNTTPTNVATFNRFYTTGVGVSWISSS